MIEGDIEERMAGFAPSQRTGPSDLAREIMSQQVAGPSMEPTVPEPSPLAREIMSRDNDSLMSSLMGAVDVNPDEAAKASRIGLQLGVGQDIALRNMPEMDHRAKMMQLRQMQLQQRDPILAEFMSDQAFARMAYDDLPNLSVIGRAFRFLRDIPTGISEGFTKAVSQAEMSQILERQRERGGYLEEYEKAALRSYQQELSELSKETGLAEAGAYLVSQQLTDWRIEDVERVVTGGVIGGGAGFVGGPLAPATVPAGIALGLKAGAATTMFERSRRMETAMLYGELEPELGHDMANKIAFGAGILNASLDVGSLGLITAPLRAPLKAAFGQAVKEAVRKRTVRDSFARFGLWYAGSVAAETGTETLQEMNNVLAMELGLYLQEKPLVLSTPEGRAEVADRLAATAVETALGMVTVGLPGPAVQFYSDVRGAARAMNEHKKLENITKAVSESKLLPRNSAALESYIASTAEGSDASTVFIDAATANDILRQSGLTDVELDAALPGVRQQIETLQEKDIPLGGSDITIPMEQFTVRIAKTPLQEQLKQHARLSAGAPSFLEAQRIRAEMAQTRAEAEQILATKQEADAAFVAEAQQVEDEAFEQVRSVGQFTDIEARTIAKLRQAMVVVDAAEAGMTPAQYQRERGVPLQVRGVQGEVVPAAPLEQAAISRMDADYLAAVERGDMETAQRMVDETSSQPGQEAVTSDEQGNIVPLSRRFDIASPKVFEQAAMFEQAPVSPGFYSALAKAVDAIDAKSIAPSGWKERIKGLVNKGEVKQDEVDWSGLTDWLDMQEGKVTKEAVAEFLKNNGVRVERVQLGQDVSRINYASPYAIPEVLRYAQENQGNAPEALLLAIENDGDVYRALARPFPELIQREDWAQVVVNDVFRGGENVQQGKFSQYVLPGGTNYREVLITLPAEDRLPVGYSVVQQEGVWKIADNSGNIVMGDFLYGQTKEIATRNAISYLKSGQIAPVFQSSHWDQPNVLVHFRLNDRVDADGKRVLFVEEIQSDWGQQGRKVGFVPTATRRQAIIDEMTAAQAAFDAAIPGSEAQADAAERATRAEEAYNKEINAASIPRAPFVETTDGWLNLGLKHILLEATQGNYDRVAFVTGQQSAERYDLSKQISRLVYQDNLSGGITKAKMDGPPTAGTLTAYDMNNGQVINQRIDNPTDLENYVGKEVAQRLLEATPKPGQNAGLQTRSRELSGLDLKVGGEGMQNFYDKIVPAAVNKLLKKYGGGKLGSVMLPNMREQELAEDAERMGMTRADVLDLAEPGEYAAAQPGFPVTPEMVKKLESGLPLFQAMRGGGPARGGIDSRTLNVFVGKGGDVSTLAHEMIHLRVAEYLRMARGTTPPARVNADLETLFDFMGVEGATFQERLDNYETMTIDQRRPLEEKVTYNFEIYLYEGKAPSVELRGVFDRLAAWMRRVYKSIRDNLNEIYRREFGTDLPILTPEVRSVFDRMLASEEQIKRQEAIEGMKGLFQTQAESGMDNAEWAAYQAMQQEATEAAVTDLNTASMRQVQWLGNARARILRDLQKKHDAKRKEVTAEVAAAVKVEPVYRAMTYLRYGRFVDTDGAEVEVEGTHRLDIEKVRAMYASLPSAEGVELIRATGMAVPANVRPDITPLGTGKYGMLGRDGLDPDVVAEMFGYSSGDEMVRALLAAKPMKDAVAERTDAEMLRRYGDMNTPAALEAEVQKALHNEARARFVAVELRHIAKATQPVRVMLETAKQVAADMISDTTIRDLRPGEFVAAEARAARDAERIQRTYGITEPAPELAQRYGTDRQQALIRAKRAQLYQNQLAAEALRVKEYVDKQVKYLRRVLRDENVKRMGADATDQVRSILDNYSLVSMTRAQREQVTDLRNWLAAEEANGMMVDIDPSLADSARRRNYTELTVSQFRELVESVKLIEYRGKNERNIYLAEQKAVFEEKRDEIVASMTEVAEKKGRKVRKDLGDEDRKWMNSIASYDASQQTIGNIVYVLDGGKRDGPLAKYLLIPSNDAGNQEATDRAAVSEKVNDIVGPLAKKGQFVAPKMYFPNINESLSLEQRMVVALNYGNQSNIDRLLNGEQWTAEQARVIIESLTEEQLQAVQSIWDVMSSFRDRVAEKSRRLTGKEPRWLEPLPMRVTSADGNIVELRGGYYPAKYNPRRSVGARELDIAGDAERLQREAYTATTTSRSFEKNRSDRPPVDQVLSRQFVAMYSGLNEVIHDLAWHDFAISATRLLRDKSFQRVIKERYGLETYNAIKDWVDVVVAGDRTKYDSFEQVAIFARQNVSVAAMGIRLLTAAVQPTGIFPAMTRTGVGPMVRAIAEFAYSPVETSRNVVSRSSFMENRGRTRFRDLNEIQNIVQEQSRLQGIRRTYISSAYVLTSFMQGLVDTSVWMAAYSNAIKEGKSEKDAVFVADQTVIDTQGSGRVQDLSSAMRGGKKQSAYAKLFTPFYQYSNTMYSLFGAQMRTAPSYSKAAKDAFLILTVGAIVEELIRYALRPSPEDEEPEDLIKKLAANQIDFVVGLPFGIREFRGAGSLIVGTEDGVQSYRGPSGLRIVTDATQAAVQARQGEFDAAFRRSMINLFGTTVGIPSAQINATIDGIEAVSKDEIEGPSAVLAPLTGVQR